MILLPVVVTLILFKPFHRRFLEEEKDFSKEKSKLDSLTEILKQYEQNSIPDDDVAPITLFQFNPNNVDLNELQNLGFAEGLRNRLINYRNKGGRFTVKSDLLKLYGMDSSFYISLAPYIDLPENQEPDARPVLMRSQVTEHTVFDLNQADTTQLKAIYGIGKVLAARIIKYRESLGGFVAPEQLKEVYGLDSMVVNRLFEQCFVQAEFQPRQLNANIASEEQLSAHPYISKTHSRAIVAYRFQHGDFQSVEDLRNVLLMDENSFIKAKPYLTVE